MAKQKKEKKPYQPDTVCIADLLSNPDLMQAEVKYERGCGIEIKVLMDTHDPKTPLTVIHQKYLDGELIFEKKFEVPYSSNFGTGPASDFLESIKLGDL